MDEVLKGDKDMVWWCYGCTVSQKGMGIEYEYD